MAAVRRRTIAAVGLVVALAAGTGIALGAADRGGDEPAAGAEDGTPGPTASSAPVDLAEFVQRDGTGFTLDGEPFYASGSNNYRPMFLDGPVVDQIMAAAAENEHPVLRAWAFTDIGDPADPTTSIDPQNATTYFQSWDADAGAPAFNDGADGLERLDRVVASAKEHGVRLVLPFVNNWGPFGGMDQYVQWAGGEYHDDFFTDERIRGWYQDWVEHLLTRVNTITGVAYRDEPTIMAWELANEPRCLASGRYEPSPDCDAETITEWATTMAAHVKSIDPNHLLGLGDEGWLCTGGGEGHWAYDCSQGVDGEAIARIDEIDMVGLHVYPDHWGTSVEWSERYVLDHVALAEEVGKPVFIGEYGWRGADPRNVVFHRWMSAFFGAGGDVALYWLMQPRDEYTTPPDSDGFTAYCPSAVCTQAGYWTRGARGDTDLPPVADVDVLAAVVDAGGQVDLLANDVSLYSTVDRASVDLDPEASGVQSELALEGGTLTVADGVLTIVATPGWTGREEVEYTVSDAEGRVSAPASVTVRVAAA